MQLTKESEDLLTALRSDTSAVAHAVLNPSVSISFVLPHLQFSDILCHTICCVQKGAAVQLQELVQAWPTKLKEDLSQAILHQVHSSRAEELHGCSDNGCD